MACALDVNRPDRCLPKQDDPELPQQKDRKLRNRPVGAGVSGARGPGGKAARDLERRASLETRSGYAVQST